jgi:hypothetical protein
MLELHIYGFAINKRNNQNNRIHRKCEHVAASTTTSSLPALSHPGRAGLWHLLDYMQEHESVWITRWGDNANHRVKTYL